MRRTRRTDRPGGLCLVHVVALGLLTLAATANGAPLAGSQGSPLGASSTESLANPWRRASTRATDTDFNLYGRRNYYVDPTLRAGDVADVEMSNNLDLSLGLPTLSSWTDVDVPFIEGNGTDDVLFRLGPLKLDAERLIASVLITDNENRTRHDRSPAAVSIFAVEGIRAMWELSDSTQLALEGNLILLPFESRGGVNGFGMPRDQLAFATGVDGTFDPLASGRSDFHGAISTDFDLGDWNLCLRDSFGLRDFSLHNDFDNYLEEELTMLELDVNPGLEGVHSDDLSSSDYARVAGASSYAVNGVGSGQLGDPDGGVTTVSTWDRTRSRSDYGIHDDEDEETNLEFTNNLSVSLSRSTGAIRPLLRVFRNDSNYWYADDEDAEREEDSEAYLGTTMGLFLDNPDLRFQPYTTYTVARDTEDRRWDQTLRVGVLGPGRITDYVSMNGNVGQYIRSENGKEDERDTLYEFRLIHQPRPLTLHSFELARYVSEPDDELRKQATYRLRQGLGSHLAASFAACRTELDKYGDDDDGQDEKEWGVGGSLSYTQNDFAAAWRSYYEQEWDEDTGEEDPDWKHQIDLRWRLASRVRARYKYTWEDEGEDQDHDVSIDVDLYRHRGIWSITYRFRCRDAADSGERYFENLLVLTAVKDLDGMTIGKLFGAER